MCLAGEEREQSPDECFAESSGLRAHAHHVQLPARVHCWSATRASTYSFGYEYSIICPSPSICIRIGEYDFVEDRDEEGIIHRVYTPLGKKNDGVYALSVHIILQFVSRIHYIYPYTDTPKQC